MGRYRYDILFLYYYFFFVFLRYLIFHDYLKSILIFCGGCLGTVTNNIVEYSVVIELLSNATSLCIGCILIHLDPQFIASQLNGAYYVHDPNLL